MNPVVETGVLIAATIVVGVTLILVPVPEQKPPEIDNPPPPTIEPPTPQEVVSPTLSITAPLVQPELSDKERVAIIEQRILHITQQVQQMEKKVK